jgi:endothelin-converting enzyme/putative endopeptidase
LAAAFALPIGCGQDDANRSAADRTPTATSTAEESAEIGAWGIDLAMRDLSVDPGDDFNRYANGQWLDTFTMPADLSRYGIFTQLALDAEEDIRAIVDELVARNPAQGTLEQKVGDFYGSWMDVGRLNELGAAPLEPHLAELAAIETKDDLIKAFASLHVTAPFGIGIIPDPADTTRYTAFVGQDGLGMPDRDYYLDESERFAQYREAYRAYVARVLTLAGIEDAEQKADAIIALETRIAEAHWTQEESRDIQKIYNPMSPDQVAALAPELNWNAIFDELGLGDVDTFVVAQTTAIDAAGEIVDDAPIDLWQAYLTFHFIRGHADKLSSDFDAAHFEFYSRTLRGAEEQRERWKRGVEQVNAGLGEAVGQVYVDRHFSPEYKAQMEELVFNLIATLEERLRQNEWMDEETRAQALLKLSTFEARIGYTEKWTDYDPLAIVEGRLLEDTMAIREFLWQEQLDRLSGPVDRQIWPYPPQTVNASYDPLLNQITFPAGILQPPFFDPHADPAVNYGAIGAVIGHEIGHGFDDQGRRFDERGRIRDWWTEIADQRFSERAARLGAQYDTYEPIPGMKVNGQLTMGENIGDLGGLQMAYAAYHRSLDQQSNGEAPVLDGLTGDQRFFLSWAQVWRTLDREDETRRRLVTDPHSPPSYRVNGVVRNLDAWYAAFDVTPDDELYLPPDERVRIW